MSQFSTARTSVTFAFDGCFLTAGKVTNWLLDFCQLTTADSETTSRLHMAAHELVDNVLKYGTTLDVGLEFELGPAEEEGSRRVTLRTRNRAAPEQVAEVVRRVNELRRAPDPIAYYDRLIRETAPLLGQSGLGLARIRAEAGLEVECAVEQPDTLTVVVQTTLQVSR